jgi:hypothetical protein
MSSTTITVENLSALTNKVEELSLDLNTVKTKLAEAMEMIRNYTTTKMPEVKVRKPRQPKKAVAEKPAVEEETTQNTIVTTPVKTTTKPDEVAAPKKPRQPKKAVAEKTAVEEETPAVEETSLNNIVTTPVKTTAKPVEVAAPKKPRAPRKKKEDVKPVDETEIAPASPSHDVKISPVKTTKPKAKKRDDSDNLSASSEMGERVAPRQKKKAVVQTVGKPVEVNVMTTA